MVKSNTSSSPPNSSPSSPQQQLAVQQHSSASSSKALKYKGVRKRKWGKWVSEIRLPHSRERIWLGSYDSAEKAARAFDAAQFCLRGQSANFNFPSNPPNISGGRNLTPSEIQAAASRFANEYNSASSSNLADQLDEEEMAVSAFEQLAMDDQVSTGSPSNSSNSFFAVSDGGTVLQSSFDHYNTDVNNFVDDGGSFFNPLTTMGSGNFDYGLFTGYGDYYTAQSPNFEYGHGNGVDNHIQHHDDGSFSAAGGDNWNNGSEYQDSFLWNF